MLVSIQILCLLEYLNCNLLNVQNDTEHIFK